MISDGFCDDGCNIFDCNFDGGDCGSTSPVYEDCNAGCPSSWIGDGICDDDCNV